MRRFLSGLEGSRSGGRASARFHADIDTRLMVTSPFVYSPRDTARDCGSRYLPLQRARDVLANCAEERPRISFSVSCSKRRDGYPLELKPG